MISFSPARRACRAATVLLIAAVLLSETQAELIPPARLTDWTPGVRTGVIGGIPTNRTRLRDVTLPPYNADNTGATDAQPAIQAAINAAALGDVVYLPAGTYRINSNIILGPSFSGKTLRGAGPASTFIDQRINEGIKLGSDSGNGVPNPLVLVTGGLTKGSTTVTVNQMDFDQDGGPHGFVVGQIITFNVQSDLNVPVVSVYNYDIHTNQAPTNQRVRVVSVNNTAKTVSFFPPLFDAYGGGSLQVRITYEVFQANGIGLEDLTIDATNHGPGAFTCVQMNNCYGSWVKNCKIQFAKNYPLYISNSLNCEVRHTYVKGLGAGGSNGAGVLVNSTSSCLVEDNIILASFPLIEVNHGSSGNVFSYNYGLDGVIITNHGPHNQFNLYEGNAGCGIKSDGYFGGENYLTVFRSYLIGGFDLKRFTRNVSFVGNFIEAFDADQQGTPNIGNGAWDGEAQLSAGDPWRDWQMTGTLTARADNNNGTITLASGALFAPGQVIRLVWGTNRNQQRFATPTSVAGDVVQIGNYSGGMDLPAVGTTVHIGPGAFSASPVGSYQEKDLDVLATLVKKGNRYFGDNSFDSLGGDTLPNSLFRTSKPSWFKDLAWPPFDPVTPRTPSIEHIPAGYRYVHGVDPPGSIPQGPSNLTAPGAPGPGDAPQSGSPKAKAEGSAKPQSLTAKETEKAETASVAAKASPSPSPKAEKPKRKTTRKKKSGGS